VADRAEDPAEVRDRIRAVLRALRVDTQVEAVALLLAEGPGVRQRPASAIGWSPGSWAGPVST
jgi:hypothetical protein